VPGLVVVHNGIWPEVKPKHKEMVGEEAKSKDKNKR